ncbi:amidase family protein, partial [Mesorhizobium sp. M0904]|uniref:amidase n=1 Tax=Mesorhizobium sp. M0904 TaxID=2957022 RepID=UPI00333D5E04
RILSLRENDMSSEFLTISEAAALIAAKRLSPVELTKMCLERVRTLNETLHAFMTVTEERALQTASEAEAMIMEKGPQGLLHGIPVGIKDNIDTKDVLTTCQSAQLVDNVPDVDATCAASLSNAGSVLMGKLTTQEFAGAGPSFDLPWPPARNPWNTAHSPGGSSSGTGVAVACGMILGGLGSDTGGSIRIPSSFCGIAGVKPTYGLVSRFGVAPGGYSLDQIGPMAWTVEDCAIILQSIAGFDPKDPTSANRSVPDYRVGLTKGAKGLKVGLVRHFHEDDCKVSAATQNGIDSAIEIYEDGGASVAEVKLSSLQEWSACGMIIYLAERAAAYENLMRSRPDKFGKRFRDRMIHGTFVTGADYVQAALRRRELVMELNEAMEGIDVLLTATEPDEAPLLEEASHDDDIAAPCLSFPFNVSGFPAMSICSGFGATGLPVAIQLAAKPFQEATLFQAANAFEVATNWRQARPKIASIA